MKTLNIRERKQHRKCTGENQLIVKKSEQNTTGKKIKNQLQTLDFGKLAKHYHYNYCYHYYYNYYYTIIIIIRNLNVQDGGRNYLWSLIENTNERNIQRRI